MNDITLDRVIVAVWIMHSVRVLQHVWGREQEGCTAREIKRLMLHRQQESQPLQIKSEMLESLEKTYSFWWQEIDHMCLRMTNVYNKSDKDVRKSAF